MKKITGLGVCVLMLAGCAAQNVAEEDSAQKLARENERRMQSLENSVTALNTQVAQLNNRVYEVRGKNGQRTAMTVVPITAPAARPAPPQAPQTASPAPPAQVVPPVKAPATAPKSRVINPAAKPSPLVANAQRTPVATPAKTPVPPPPSAENIGLPPQTGGPSGQLAASSTDMDLGLPPADIPAVPQAAHTTSIVAPASQQNIPSSVTAEPVPVPVFPVSDLSLPPEHPGLPPAAAPEVAAPAPAPQPQAAPRAVGALQKGEEAAYQNALKAARAGRTEEGIRLFRDFLQKYPNGRYAANADFWIGECLYSQGKYQDALNQFQEVNSTFPKHHKNADALLKAAMTMQKMGDGAGAQSKYKELIASFPNSDAAKRARAMGLGR